ncbi:MAG: Spy/CpxP family protein refolding chaperone [Bacteroidales bacterium]|nr:Spy/CpxP family protein refolding chaperone [Bacteroidales bacterium]
MNKKFLIIEVVILLALTAVNIYLTLDRKEPNKCMESCCVDTECYLSNAISLTEAQKQQYQKIKEKYQEQAMFIADSLHVTQESLMESLKKNNQDSLKIKEIEGEIAKYQTKLLDISVNQYNEIKSILTPSQIPALDKLFTQIFVCRPTCKTHTHIH